MSLLLSYMRLALFIMLFFDINAQNIITKSLTNQKITIQSNPITQTIYFPDITSAYKFDAIPISKPSLTLNNSELCYTNNVKLVPEPIITMNFIDPLRAIYYNGSIIARNLYHITIFEFDILSRQITSQYNIESDSLINMRYPGDGVSEFIQIDEINQLLLILNDNQFYYSIYDNSISWTELNEITEGFIPRNSIQDFLIIDGLGFICGRYDGVDIYDPISLLNTTTLRYVLTLNSNVLLSYTNQTMDIVDIEYNKQQNKIMLLDQNNGIYEFIMPFTSMNSIKNTTYTNNNTIINPIYPIINMTGCYRFIMKNLIFIIACKTNMNNDNDIVNIKTNNNQYNLYEYTYNSTQNKYIQTRKLSFQKHIIDLMADDYFVYIQTIDTFEAYQHSIPYEYQNVLLPTLLLDQIKDASIFSNIYPYLFLIIKFNTIDIYDIKFIPPSLTCNNTMLNSEGKYIYQMKALQKICSDLPIQTSIYDACIFEFEFLAKIYTPIFENEQLAIIIGLCIGLIIGIIAAAAIFFQWRKNKFELEKLKGKYLQIEKVVSPIDLDHGNATLDNILQNKISQSAYAQVTDKQNQPYLNK